MASGRFASLVDKFQAAVLSAARAGAVVLVGTARLARALRERWRAEQMADGRSGWERAPVFSLGAWARHVWSQSWPDRVPAPPYLVWRRWIELATDDPPPGEDRPGPDLAEALDVAYTVLADYVPTPPRAEPYSPVVEWRRRLFDRLDRVLDQDGFFHPGRLSALVARGISAKRVVIPQRVVRAGFDFPSAAERALFAALEAAAELTRLDLPAAPADKTRAVALADREREGWWVVAETIRAAARTPLSHIGLVVPASKTYGPDLDRAFGQALGENRPGDGFWYGSARRRSLLDRPLVKAALAPLRAVARPVDRSDLLDLIGSPFFSALSGSGPEVFEADRLWRERPVFGSVRDFLSDPALAEGLRLGPSGRRLDEALAPLMAAGPKPVAVWTRDLGLVLDELGFESPQGDEDQADHLAFELVLSELARDLGPMAVDGAGFQSWLEAALRRTPARTEGSERAGVQVLLPEEARGLCFDRLFVLGLDARSWPRPVRRLPLLSPGEGAQVLGGTVESEYRFSARAFGVLCASAAEVVLSRPRHQEDEPRPASIFWPGHEEEVEVSPWRELDPAWLRARWYGDAWQGRFEPRPEFTDAPAPGLIPRTVSVSGLETALACPARFLAQVVLGLRVLEEPEPGVSPRARGMILHRALQLFTRRSRDEQVDVNGRQAERLLAECVDAALGELRSDPAWRLERARWLDEPGLLRAWLDHQREHQARGWRTIAEELSFTGLDIEEAGLAISGRIDRLDAHPDEGLLAWDYKTGQSPGKREVFEDLIRPQLPAYLEAVRGGACPLPEDCRPTARRGQVRAAYLELRSAAEVRPRLHDQEAAVWSLLSDQWRARLGRLFEPLHAGSFAAEPYPVSPGGKTDQACRECPYQVLCAPRGGELEETAR